VDNSVDDFVKLPPDHAPGFPAPIRPTIIRSKKYQTISALENSAAVKSRPESIFRPALAVCA
jgi:hypothetical protein